MTPDPIQLALTQNRLDYITRQMGEVMVRTARSPIFSQAHDFTCFVCGPDGWLVSQADGIPIHSGGGGFAVRAVLRDFADDIEPGDVFVLNDPWQAGGNHLPDWVIARPVFVDDRRVAFCCNRAHQSDIGGGAPGAYNPLAHDTWQEGVRLPALKLVSRGETRRDLWRLLLANSRTPELQDGDLRAMIGATRIGAERVAEFAEEVTVERALALFDGILDHAERRMRTALAALPDGVYEGADHSDNDCFGPYDLAVRARLTIDGDRATVDLSGSSPQIRGFKNSTWANTCSSVYTAFASFFEPDIPRNEGTFRAIELVAPEGSIVNATEGAATTMCTVFVAHEIIHACWKALGAASPERACAGWAKNVFGITTGRHGDGRRYVLYHGLAAAGAGAVDGRDGFNQIGHLCTLGGLVMPSLEVYEQLYPVRYRRCEFRRDGGGAGEWRGGTGVEYEIDVHTEGTWSFRGEGLRYKSGYGAASGLDGEGGEMEVHPADAPAFEAPKFGLRELGPARLEVSSPGGGGFGDPLERDPERVLRDVRDGVVSVEAARDFYGVVIAPGGMRADADATARQRCAKRRALPANNDR